MIALPAAIATYFSARADSTRQSFDACFAADAVVQDEAKIHQGLAEIKAWHIAANAPVQATRVLSIREDGSKSIVTAEVSGSFKGSPVTLNFNFTLKAGLIAELEIH